MLCIDFYYFKDNSRLFLLVSALFYPSVVCYLAIIQTLFLDASVVLIWNGIAGNLVRIELTQAFLFN